ncbi:ATP-binding protein [Streptantibioticus silvisoli]|uniref:ATP-binding protein n=1 Tax=Streptantibioticus silvisoli TaxID=2705255 RepID=A0ABT6VW37_9ACTN|nr:ATP-binding protein [Streptantibioticus silvisoli]MDI5962692.1 ATP-binding protein [Streptantibioticus silvisoli]
MDSQHRGPEDGEETGPAPAAGRPGGDRAERDLAPPSRAAGGVVPRPSAAAVVVPPHGTAVPVPSAPRDPGPRGASRVTQIVAGDYLVTVNPVDGSEVTGAPRDRVPSVRRRTAAERADRARAARPAPVAVTAALPLLERADESDRLVRLLSRGRSVRLTGPSGSGRTVLLNAVADRCADLAPDGVIRLSGHHRTPADLRQELYAAVHHADGYRPVGARLAEGTGSVGAIVVLDDVEFGGAALDELLASAADCAFLIAATPRVPAPSAGSAIEEVFLSGLSKTACAKLLARAAERELSKEESSWAADLWFASEGLPLRFVQAGALLRQRAGGLSRAVAESLSFDKTAPAVPKDAAPRTAATGPLPSLAQSAAPARLLAGRLSRNGREALRIAVALGGECVHQSHLPALIGAEQADTALAELIACGLATPVAGHYRLAAGVLEQLDGTEETDGHALTAARHYVWWAAHPSVPATRVAAEADAILAAAAACRDSGEHEAAVRLARAAAPEFAAALYWSAWERALRTGQEAARLAGEVGEEAYFHHELGVLALCGGNLDRARTELEASIAMRGALGDRQGSLVGRRTLALVNDRAGTTPPVALPAGPGPAKALQSGRPSAARTAPTTAVVPAGRPAHAVQRPAHALPPGAVPVPSAMPAVDHPGAGRRKHRGRRAVVQSRRNLAAAGAGAVIAAVLGTVVTLGATSASRPSGSADGKPGGTVAQNDDPGVPADQPTEASSTSRPPSAPDSPTAPSASTSAAAPSTTPSPGATPSTAPTTPGSTTSPPKGGGSPSTSTSPTPSAPPTTAPPTSPPPTTPPPTSPPPTTPPSSPPPSSPAPTQPTNSQSASATPTSPSASAPAPVS